MTLMTHTMTEAFCTKCRETFVPDGPDDLEHGVREDGEPCGGMGQITGDWVYTPELEGPKKSIIEERYEQSKLNAQERVENAAFEGLIRKYTERRDWQMVAKINALYGMVLDDRQKDKNNG